MSWGDHIEQCIRVDWRPQSPLVLHLSGSQVIENAADALELRRLRDIGIADLEREVAELRNQRRWDIGRWDIDGLRESWAKVERLMEENERLRRRLAVHDKAKENL